MENQEGIRKTSSGVAIYGSLMSGITIYGSPMSESGKGMEVHVLEKYWNVGIWNYSLIGTTPDMEMIR